ncbi:hypothetical protein AXX16_3914 [Serratia rubidaea]|nr:hypothetical protein AXX16_3914 [Serratia rubidaea]
MQQHAFVAIDKRDFRFAGSRGGEAGIECEITFGTEGANIKDIRAQGWA